MAGGLVASRQLRPVQDVLAFGGGVHESSNPRRPFRRSPLPVVRSAGAGGGMARRPPPFPQCAVAAPVSLPVAGLGQTLAPRHALTFRADVEVIRLSLSVTDSEDRLLPRAGPDEVAVFGG